MAVPLLDHHRVVLLHPLGLLMDKRFRLPRQLSECLRPKINIGLAAQLGCPLQVAGSLRCVAPLGQASVVDALPCLQPLQPGTTPPLTRQFQAQPCRRARRVAAARGGLIPCRRWRTQTLRLSSDSAVWRAQPFTDDEQRAFPRPDDRGLIEAKVGPAKVDPSLSCGALWCSKSTLFYSTIKYVIIPYVAMDQTPSQSALLPASQAPSAPAVLRRAGKNALFAADEFFAARISNPHTRRA